MASYAQFSITDRNKLKKYIKSKLGGSLITLEITDEDLDFCIDEALEQFSERVHYDQEYFVLELAKVIPITKENPDGNYCPDRGYRLPENVVSVNAIHEGENYWFQNQGTTAEFMFYNAGMYPTFNNTNFQSPGRFLDVYLAQTYLKQAAEAFGYRYNYNFNERSKFLKLSPDPQKTRTGRKQIILEVSTIRPEDQLLGERSVKTLAVGHAMVMIGNVREKFGSGVSLPGGGQVSAEIGQKGQDIIDKELERLDNYQPPFMFFMQQ